MKSCNMCEIAEIKTPDMVYMKAFFVQTLGGERWGKRNYYPKLKPYLLG